MSGLQNGARTVCFCSHAHASESTACHAPKALIRCSRLPACLLTTPAHPSPCRPAPGAQLASSGDGGEVLLWEPVDPASAGVQRGNLEEDEGEATWRRAAALKGHGREGDVMDLGWAPDGSALATASIDSEVMLWATDGRRAAKQAGRLVNHKHFVQGVAWDPAQQYVATQSADRTCRCAGAAGPKAAGAHLSSVWPARTERRCVTVRLDRASAGRHALGIEACHPRRRRLLISQALPVSPADCGWEGTPPPHPTHAPQGVCAQASGVGAQEQGVPVPAARWRDCQGLVLRAHAEQAAPGR